MQMCPRKWLRCYHRFNHWGIRYNICNRNPTDNNCANYWPHHIGFSNDNDN